jgi:hypothetical protein
VRSQFDPSAQKGLFPTANTQNLQLPHNLLEIGHALRDQFDLSESKEFSLSNIRGRTTPSIGTSTQLTAEVKFKRRPLMKCLPLP